MPYWDLAAPGRTGVWTALEGRLREARMRRDGMSRIERSDTESDGYSSDSSSSTDADVPTMYPEREWFELYEERRLEVRRLAGQRARAVGAWPRVQANDSLLELVLSHVTRLPTAGCHVGFVAGFAQLRTVCRAWCEMLSTDAIWQSVCEQCVSTLYCLIKCLPDCRLTWMQLFGCYHGNEYTCGGGMCEYLLAITVRTAHRDGNEEHSAVGPVDRYARGQSGRFPPDSIVGSIVGCAVCERTALQCTISLVHKYNFKMLEVCTCDLNREDRNRWSSCDWMHDGAPPLFSVELPGPEYNNVHWLDRNDARKQVDVWQVVNEYIPERLDAGVLLHVTVDTEIAGAGFKLLRWSVERGDPEYRPRWLHELGSDRDDISAVFALAGSAQCSRRWRSGCSFGL